jgi:hypothetical protein
MAIEFVYIWFCTSFEIKWKLMISYYIKEALVDCVYAMMHEMRVSEES